MEVLTYHLKPECQPSIYILPSRGGLVDSTIIKGKHVALIGSWIDKKNTTYTKSPYDFKLLYRASRDGFTVAKFRELCGNISGTVVVCKISGCGKIVGGYNSTNWGNVNYNYNQRREQYLNVNYNQHREQYLNDNNVFIFSFGDGKDLKTAKLGRKTSGGYAIAYHSSYGPYFYNDLCIGQNGQPSGWYQYGNYTPTIFEDNSGQRENFQLDDYEVLQVVSK